MKLNNFAEYFVPKLQRLVREACLDYPASIKQRTHVANEVPADGEVLEEIVFILDSLNEQTELTITMDIKTVGRKR